MTPTREHRAEALNMWCHWDHTKVEQETRNWVESGSECDHTILVLIAQALADRDARIGELEAGIVAIHNEATKARAYLDQVREIPPGAIVVDLGNSTTRSELESLSYIDDEGDRARPFVGRLDQLGNLDTPYNMTLVLELETA